MLLDALNARTATEMGGTLALQIAGQLAENGPAQTKSSSGVLKDSALKALLQQVDRDVRPLKLNFFKKSKFANAFKWTLLEKGCDPILADELTHAVLMHLSVGSAKLAPTSKESKGVTAHSKAGEEANLLSRGDACFARGAFDDAIRIYQMLIERNPRHADALNNLASVLYRVGRYDDAEEFYRKAIRVKPDHLQAHANLGLLLRTKGDLIGSECSYRLALRSDPHSAEAQAGLGMLDIAQGQMDEAKPRFEKVVAQQQRHIEALLGLAYIAKVEGEFEQAEALLKRVLKIEPALPAALAAMVGLRTMRSSDEEWIKQVEKLLARGVAPTDERELRFAAGKYYDDVHEFERAFHNYRLANELSKTNAPAYAKEKDTQFVSQWMRIYTADVLNKSRKDGSPSIVPVFVVGMPRSGTSLVEQIIASHPSARGAGELSFWNDVVRENESALRKAPLNARFRHTLAENYLRILSSRCGDVLKIVDKAPVNARYLGLIHSVFPNARIINVQRDPIDTCLSCYFQPFQSGMSYTFDLSSLAHYYKEQHRLMAHWRAVLPRGVILDVPYEAMVKAPDEWTRDILEFLDLPWDDRCLNFHDTKRMVSTASYWQVRQKIYQHSVERWRNYERFLGPLMELKGLS